VGITYRICHLLYIKPTFVGAVTITVSFPILKLCIENFNMLRINKELLLLINYELKVRAEVERVPVLHPTN
jgi:hypothetical protein